MIRLYHFPLSPFCRKVRLTLAEKRLEVELVEERYWEPSPDFLRRNPAGKVPVLRWDNRVMSESQAICEYLEERFPEPALIGRTADSVVLSSGVQPGERVVTAGVNSLKPGQKVTFDEDAQ